MTDIQKIIQEALDFAEAMTLYANKDVLPEMLEKNSENWAKLLEMISESQTEIYERLAEHDDRLSKIEADIDLINSRLDELEENK
ncbi:hypothetical protein JavanS250_0005 [Streptococcus satellite phage Javan250]|uniref:hypothetical protein n=1 Tax=Streptococcus halotolerans TaxID=1814128 RepID=UPI0007869193|nr:hypothetical protein [Streptococcus halotolerans]QBX08338.1 hypothetical protein JavanS250_0005 [Streptococcus satellite phage Javan250]